MRVGERKQGVLVRFYEGLVSMYLNYSFGSDLLFAYLIKLHTVFLRQIISVMGQLLPDQ